MRRKNPKFDNDFDRRDDESRGSGERRNTERRQSRPESRRPRSSGSDNDRRKSRPNRPDDRKKSFGDRREWTKPKAENDSSKSFEDRRNRDVESRGSDEMRERTQRKKFSSPRSTPRVKYEDKTGYKKRESGESGESKDSNRKTGFRKGGFSSDRPSKGKFGDKKFSKRGGGERRFENDRTDRPQKYGEKSFGEKKRSEYSSYSTKRKLRPRRKIQDIEEDDGLIRLNKYIANSGMCSRRQADEYIRTGVVEVNGVVVTEMGFKVKPEDDVRFDGKRLTPEKKTYLILNKPKGFITTTNDEKDRKTVMDLVAGATNTRLFPVGRLDRQTTGVLLFTNDGYLAKKLTHPSHQIKKIYHVVLDRNLHGDDMEKIRQGIRMHEGVAMVDKVSFIEGKAHNEVGLEIHIGWNRVVRRIFEKLGYKVEALDRVQFAGLTKKRLKRGDWRILDEKEVGFLKMM